jgi:hypothetical protein
MSYHSVLGNTKSMRLNATDAVQTATTYWNDTSPTSIVFSLGSDTKGNASSTMIAYCFAEKKDLASLVLTQVMVMLMVRLCIQDLNQLLLWLKDTDRTKLGYV